MGRMWGEGDIGGQRGLQGLDAAGDCGKELGLCLVAMEKQGRYSVMVSFAFHTDPQSKTAGKLLWRLLKYSRGGGQPRVGPEAWRECSGSRNIWKTELADLGLGAKERDRMIRFPGWTFSYQPSDSASLKLAVPSLRKPTCPPGGPEVATGPCHRGI